MITGHNTAVQEAEALLRAYDFQEPVTLALVVPDMSLCRLAPEIHAEHQTAHQNPRS